MAAAGIACLGFVLLLTPTGSLPSPRWRGWARVAAAVAVTVVALLVGALSLVVRFRNARGTERQQLRWVALAAVLASLAILMALAGMVTRNAALRNWGIGVSFTAVVLGLGQLLGGDSSLAVAAATLAVARCSSPPAAASRPSSTAASTAAATTPPRPSPPSAVASVTRSTSTP